MKGIRAKVITAKKIIMSYTQGSRESLDGGEDKQRDYI